MDQRVIDAYDAGGVIDITTTGAKSGLPRRIEINFLCLDDHLYITGRPGGKRDWLANLAANPEFMVHLKHGDNIDLNATARVITDEKERAEVLYKILVDGWGNPVTKAEHILSRWVEGSPLIEFKLD